MARADGTGEYVFHSSNLDRDAQTLRVKRP
jgi:hypothetical protein